MRKLIKSPITSFNADIVAGKTIIVTDNPDYIYRPGGMDGWILNCTIKGQGQVNRGENQFVCSLNDMLLFPPRVAHDYGRFAGADIWVHQWVYFFPRPTWDRLLEWPDVRAGVLRFTVQNVEHWRNITQRMEDLFMISKSMARNRFELCMNALEEVLLWRAESQHSISGGAVDNRIQQCMEFIREHYDEELLIDHLARVCSLSPSRLAHLFTEQVGVSPMRYLEEYRIRTARELLLGTMIPISEIAYKTGFKDPLYFSHVFRRVVGKPPREFRSFGGRTGFTRERTLE